MADNTINVPDSVMRLPLIRASVLPGTVSLSPAIDYTVLDGLGVPREFYNAQLATPHTPRVSPVRRAVGSVIPTELMSADYASFELRVKRRALDYYNSGLYNQLPRAAQTPPAALPEAAGWSTDTGFATPAAEPVKYVKQYYKQILLLTDLQHSDGLPPVDQEATLQAVTSLLLRPPADFQLVANYTFWLHNLARRCNFPATSTGPRLSHVCLAGAYFTAVAAQNANFYEGDRTAISGISVVSYSTISGIKRADTCVVVLGGSKETKNELAHLNERDGDYALFAFPETGGLAASLADTPNVCIPTPELQELPWPEKFQHQLQRWVVNDMLDLPYQNIDWAIDSPLKFWPVPLPTHLT